MLRRPAKSQQKTPKQNSALSKVRKKVIIQAAIALQTVVIALALIFGMSAAWYTNVLQTSGLQFEAEAWGFTGSVDVTTDPIKAGPGDFGNIGMRVTNTGEDLVNVAVNVTKIQMNEQMQKRLFFYVDAAANRNGEMLERVYVNTKDSYTYSLLSKSELVLSQERSNDAQLKWQWVYDVLGYYFLGSVAEVENAVVEPSVVDYLRPVEYDLDTATFVDGKLATANGLTADEFLKQLTDADGYAGEVTASGYPGYYQVSVDENGYGVWLYLCNWAEIQQETNYDNQLGKAAADGIATEQYTARLTVIGQVTQAEYVQVTNEDQLITALNAGEMVQLRQNLTLEQPMALQNGANTVLDMNGFTVTGPETGPAITLTNGASLTVLNGNIRGAAANTGNLVSITGATLTLSDVKISGARKDAIDITDQADGADSCVRLFDCNIEAERCAVYLRGDGTTKDGKTQVVIENSVIKSNYIAVTGSGNNVSWGTELQIYHSEITGKYAAVYHPQSDGIVRVTDSTLSGITGIVIKGGELVIKDSVISGTGKTNEIFEPAVDGSGFTDTGDGVYVDCSYQHQIIVGISGDKTKITSTNAQAVRIFDDSNLYALVEITGGTYSTDVAAMVPDGYVCAGVAGEYKVASVEVTGNEE
jgi:hypothetical protein